MRFKDIIEDYNKFVEDNYVIGKIKEFSKNVSMASDDKFLKDALSEWAHISKL